MKLTTADYERIAERMFADVADNVKQFDPDTVDFESVFEKHFEIVAGDPLYESDYMAAFNSTPVQEAFDEIKTYVREYWEDYYKTPEEMYGWNSKDYYRRVDLI